MSNKSQDCSSAIEEIERQVSNWIERYQNLPEVEKLPLHNENRASVLKGEIARLNEILQWIEVAMLELDSDHERYLIDNNGFWFRNRDGRSVENTDLMFGPHDPCLEDWMAEFRNDLLECRYELIVELSIVEKGDIGEENVFRELHLRYPTLSNIVLDVADEGGATNETDFYAILPHGVAVIEVKNYGKRGQQIWVKDAPKWDITTETGHVIDDRKNPFLQNKRHINATRKVLEGLLSREIPLFSVVVLGNNQVQIMNDTDLVVTNPRGLCSVLEKFTTDVTLTEQEQGAIMRHLQSLDIGSRSFKCISYRKRAEHIYQLTKDIFPALCNNKEIRTRYYTDSKKRNNRLAAIPIGLMALALLVFRNIGMVIFTMLCVSLIISAVVVTIQTLRKFFPGFGMPTRKILARKVYQRNAEAVISAGSNHIDVKIGAFNRYVLTKAKRYPINFDAKISLKSFPERYVLFEPFKEEIARVEKESAAYIKEHFGIDDFSLSDLKAIYRMTCVELTLGFQMIRHMYNPNIGTFVGLDEAEQYYQKFFKGVNILCDFPYVNVLQHKAGPNCSVDELPLFEELGLNSPIWCRNRNGEVLFCYREDLDHGQKILTMMAECHHYAESLLELGDMYYEFCGVVVNEDGSVFEVSDWKQTRENFNQLFSNMWNSCEISSAEFLKAIV